MPPRKNGSRDGSLQPIEYKGPIQSSFGAANKNANAQSRPEKHFKSPLANFSEFPQQVMKYVKKDNRDAVYMKLKKA